MVGGPDEIIPNLTTTFVWLDFGGVAVFAITGALVAAKAEQDVVTTVFFAVVSGMGGGTVRDLLIGAPVFWIDHRGYLESCLIVALVVFVLDTQRWSETLLNWADAVGLSVYCVTGTLKALSFGAQPVAAAAMGVVTCSVGGIIRDIMAMRPSLLTSREFYITAAIVGAGLTVVLIEVGLTQQTAGAIAACAALATRAGAILFGWKQPRKRSSGAVK